MVSDEQRKEWFKNMAAVFQALADGKEVQSGYGVPPHCLWETFSPDEFEPSSIEGENPSFSFRSRFRVAPKKMYMGVWYWKNDAHKHFFGTTLVDTPEEASKTHDSRAVLVKIIEVEVEK